MKLLLMLSFALLQAATQAQEILPLPADANLDSLSNVYLAACDNRCLVLDAVQDKLIAPGSPYNISYISGGLTVNGKGMPDRLREKYLDKIKHLAACRGYKGPLVGYNLTLKDSQVYLFPIADLNFKGYKQPVCTFSHSADSLLINKLAAANLISLADKAIIRYNSEGIWINDRKLSVKQERRFLPLLERITHIPANEELVGITYTPPEMKHYAAVNSKLIHY